MLLSAPYAIIMGINEKNDWLLSDNSAKFHLVHCSIQTENHPQLKSVKFSDYYSLVFTMILQAVFSVSPFQGYFGISSAGWLHSSSQDIFSTATSLSEKPDTCCRIMLRFLAQSVLDKSSLAIIHFLITF